MLLCSLQLLFLCSPRVLPKPCGCSARLTAIDPSRLLLCSADSCSFDHHLHGSTISEATCQSQWLAGWLMKMYEEYVLRQSDRNTGKDSVRQIRLVTLTSWAICYIFNQSLRPECRCTCSKETRRASYIERADKTGSKRWRNFKQARTGDRDEEEGTSTKGKTSLYLHRGRIRNETHVGTRHRWTQSNTGESLCLRIGKVITNEQELKPKQGN